MRQYDKSLRYKSVTLRTLFCPSDMVCRFQKLAIALSLFITITCLVVVISPGAVVSKEHPSACAGNRQENQGSLVPHAANPRYFSHTGQSRPIYLAGSHTWNNLVDMDAKRPTRRFDFPRYIDFLKAHRHNLIRLWAWEVTNPMSARYERRQVSGPQPWPRVGPEHDLSGLPKFDLTQGNEVYFRRLRERVALAHAHGIYVIVMLFEGWAVQFAPGRDSHPFNADNNINGIDHGGEPRDIHTLKIPSITHIQEEYLRRVIDAIGDCPNVLFEIANEAGNYSTAWQLHMVEFIRNDEQLKSIRHPVGMTWQMHGYNATLIESPVDWFSPNWTTGNYYDAPRPTAGAQVIINDTDHLGGSAFGDRKWVWKSFTRGLNLLFMDRYERPDSVTDRRYSKAKEVRVAMGHTRMYADRIDLAHMLPRTDISSGEFALASQREYLIYEPDGGSTLVDLRQAPSMPLSVEWFSPATGDVALGDSVAGGQRVMLKSPFQSDVVLYIHPYDDKKGAIAFANDAQHLYRIAESYMQRSITEKARYMLQLMMPNLDYKHMILSAGIGLGLGFLVGIMIRSRSHRRYSV